jgi:nucleoside-diphosphate-sugar epimerase
MRILVTGVAGFVGSHVAERLLSDGHDVVGLDGFTDYYPRPVKERNLGPILGRPRFTFHEADLRRDPLGPALDGVEAVIHEAAMPGLPRSWSDFEAYLDCNVLGVARLMEACRAAEIRRFLHASTSSVYGLEAVGDETMPLKPISPYGVTKLAAEQLILAHVATFGFPAVIVRYFSIFGPRQRPDMAYHRFIEAMLDGRPITLFGDGEQTRSNTYISDAITGTLGALEGGRIGEVYNIGGGESLSVNEAIGAIAEVLGVDPIVERAQAQPGDQRRTGADTSRAERTFGYRPTIGAHEGLRRQVDWHRALRKG